MKSEKEIKEFYDRLKEQLVHDTTWPSEYYYKFIYYVWGLLLAFLIKYSIPYNLLKYTYMF